MQHEGTVDGRVTAVPAAMEGWSRSLTALAGTLQDQQSRWQKKREDLDAVEPDLASRLSVMEDKIWQVRAAFREQAAELVGFAQALAALDAAAATGPVSVEVSPEELRVRVAAHRFAKGLRVDLGVGSADGVLPLSETDAQERLADHQRLEEILRVRQVATDPGGSRLFPFADLGTDRQGYLTQTEITLLKDLSVLDQYRFFGIKAEALSRAEVVVPGVGEDDHQDAFRHAYWSARLGQQFGADWAIQYTTAHEAGAGNPADREAMDLHNNAVGHGIGRGNPTATPNELAEVVEQELRAGSLVVIDHNGDLVFSDWLDEVPGRRSDDPPAEGIPNVPHSWRDGVSRRAQVRDRPDR